MANPRWWRQWHRWIGIASSIFLVFAAITGILVAIQEFWGEEETLREKTRGMVSPVTLALPPDAWTGPISRAMTTAATIAPGAPIDKIQTQFKGDAPTVTIFTGKPEGGEDRKLVFSAATGALISNETYADKPFLYRLHSGEAFGDGGLVVAMFWGAALAIMGISGIVIYFTMKGKRELTGLKKVFW